MVPTNDESLWMWNVLALSKIGNPVGLEEESEGGEFRRLRKKIFPKAPSLLVRRCSVEEEEDSEVVDSEVVVEEDFVMEEEDVVVDVHVMDLVMEIAIVAMIEDIDREITVMIAEVVEIIEEAEIEAVIVTATETAIEVIVEAVIVMIDAAAVEEMIVVMMIEEIAIALEIEDTRGDCGST